MADELTINLNNYKLQLQQVEAALTSDPTNDDLLKLKNDLTEVLELTKDLIKQQSSDTSTPGDDSSTKPAEDGAKSTTSSTSTQPSWKVGDKCFASWSQDGKDYAAVIDEILENGTCTVTFQEYTDITDVIHITHLKPYNGGRKREFDDGEGALGKRMKKRDIIAAQREYKRKKSQKKAQRLKQMDEERETEKNKWLDFSTKNSKGKSKKSIFASPDSSSGKVGVGTCGVSGKPMTEYSHQQKWKK